MTLLQLLKAVALVGVTLLVGSTAFYHLIWRPALQSAEPAHVADVDGVLRRRLLWLASASTLVVALAAIGDLLRIASEFTGGALLSAESIQLVTTVSATNVGRFLVFRVSLAGLCWAALLAEEFLPRVAPGLAALFGLGLLATFSLTGHSAASVDTVAWPVLTDLIHLAATVVWYGGLCCLLMLPWSRLQAGENGLRTVSRAVDRFARMGLITMAVLALTGTVLAVRQLYGLAALVEHPYGETLFVKLGFLAGVLALAGFNHLIVQPRLNKGLPEATKLLKPFRWAVTGEVVLGVAVVITAGLLSTTSPPQGEPFRVTVTMMEGSMRPVDLDLPVNRPIRMTVVNRAATAQMWVAPDLPHEMEGHAHGAMTGMIFYVEPGQAVTQTFIIGQPGQYPIECEGLGPTPSCKSGVITVR